MSRHSLRKKIILYFVPLLLCIVLFGAYYIYILSNIHKQLSRLHQDVTPNVVAILELKELLLILELGVKEKRVEKKQIQEKIVRLEEIVSSHGDHKMLLNPGDIATHDMMHKTIRTMSLSKYVLKQSDSGWQDADLVDVSETIHRELIALGPILDQHQPHVHLISNGFSLRFQHYWPFV